MCSSWCNNWVTQQHARRNNGNGYSCRRGNNFLYNVCFFESCTSYSICGYFCNTRTLYYFCATFLAVSIDAFKAQISTAPTAGWKPAEGINVRLLCLLRVMHVATSVTGRVFVQRSPTERERVRARLIVYDLQTPKVVQHVPELGCCATEENTSFFGPEDRREVHTTLSG